MPLTQDAILSEGKRRVQRSNPGIGDEQWSRWVNEARGRGARFELVPGSCIATYQRPDALPVNVAPAIAVPPVIEQATAPSRVKPARAKASRPPESRLPLSVDLAVVQDGKGAIAVNVTPARGRP